MRCAWTFQCVIAQHDENDPVHGYSECRRHGE